MTLTLLWLCGTNLQCLQGVQSPGQGGEGMDTPQAAQCCLWAVSLGPNLWGWGVGAGGMPTFGLEGAGCWQWAVGWAGVLSREAQQGDATKPPKCFSYAHPSRGD